MSEEAKEIVQHGLDQRRENRLYRMADKEVIGVIDGKHDREARAAEEARRRTEEAKMRIKIMNEEIAKRQEEYEAQQLENMKGLKKAFALAGCIVGAGLLHIVGAVRPAFAIVAGSVCGLCALTVIAAAGYAYWEAMNDQ